MLRQSIFVSRQSLVKTKSFYVATKYFYVVIELSKVKRIYVVIEYFYVATEFRLRWGFYVGIEYSYITIEFDLDKGFLVSIEYFLVTTEFEAKAKRVYIMTELPKLVLQQGEPSVQIESSRTWVFSMSRHGTLCRDSGARHCVATRLCAHDRDALSRQCSVVLCRDREDHARGTD